MATSWPITFTLQAYPLLITKDTKLGVMDKTGTYAKGIHLHTEMRKYQAGQAALVSPFATSSFQKDLSAGWFNPLQVVRCKISRPDYQTYTTVNNVYINPEDKAIAKVS